MDLHDRHHIAALEARNLAPYALRASASEGRRHATPAHPLRTEFQRDRDRVIHSRAFRRLEYKTQVFVAGSADDHFRTRLTHTIEVAGIARTIARGLALNEDLAETIALAHDLGHPPFGHCGERELNRLLAEHGGFDHNQQALRVVDDLEEKYPGMLGLNLTWETRSGLFKHRRPGLRLDGRPLPPQPSLEAQVADVADDATYLSHDVDDGISAGLIGEADLSELRIWQLAREALSDQPSKPGDPTYFPIMVRNLIDLSVANIVHASRHQLEQAGISEPNSARQHPDRLVSFSPDFAEHCQELRRFLYKKVYWHPAVDDDNQTAVRLMSELYHYLLTHPEELGRKAKARLQRDGNHRATADHIAGMTDRYAIQEYRRLIGG